jgi:hypothetical protein
MKSQLKESRTSLGKMKVKVWNFIARTNKWVVYYRKKYCLKIKWF